MEELNVHNNHISVDDLYKNENVCSDKFEQKIKKLEKEIKSLFPTAEERLRESIFGNWEDVKRKRKANEKQAEILEEKLKKYKSWVEKKRIIDTGYGLDNSRRFPSLELQNKVVEEYLYLCDIYAKKYFIEYRRLIEYNEIYQTAALGLIYAAKYYIPSDIATFETYASRCIENTIVRTYNKNNQKVKSTTYEEVLIKSYILCKYIDLMKVRRRYLYEDSLTKSINAALSLSKLQKHCIKTRNIKLKSNEDFTWKMVTLLYNSILKKTKFSKIISSEERNTISLELTQTKLSEKNKDYETLKLYIKNYMRKLSNLMIYDKVCKEITNGNNFITDELIIEKANEFISDTNKKYNKLKKLIETNQKTGLANFSGMILYTDNIIEDEYDKAFGDIVGFDSKDEEIAYSYYQRRVENFRGKKYRRYYITPQMYYRDLLETQFDELYGKDIDSKQKKEFVDFYMKEVSEQAKSKVFYEERKESLKKANNELYKTCMLGNIGLRKWDKNTLEEIREFNRMNTSLNVIISDDEIEEKEYKTRQTLEEEIEGKYFISDYKKCLNELDLLEQQVLNNWYDEEFKHSHSAKEIAAELNTTVKEVEKIKNKALEKVRKNPIMKKYENFID